MKATNQKVLIIGQGGREHALVKAFARSPSVSEIHAIPGNDGMKKEALCHNLDWRDTEKIIDFCIRNEISFVFIGPEDPLVAGLSDDLRERGILVVGPSREGAKLEGSKIFAKEFMTEARVPTSFHQIVKSTEDVIRLSGRFTLPYVLKADGLAAGKGVFICKTIDELKAAAQFIFEQKGLGFAGDQALLEQFMPGWELSYLIMTNGKEYQAFPLAQDHKRLKDNDQGPNTGGMGVVAPMKISAELNSKIENEIVKPVLQLLEQKNILYRGILYIGLMITNEGPKVVEFNCRFGDPETQVILPLLDGDFGQIFRELSLGHVTELKQKKYVRKLRDYGGSGLP